MDEDDSGLTFEEWDPSADTDSSEAPVTMIVNSSQLCAVGFTAWVPGGIYSPWITTMSSGHDVSECVLGASGLLPMFHHNNRGKISASKKTLESAPGCLCSKRQDSILINRRHPVSTPAVTALLIASR